MSECSCASSDGQELCQSCRKIVDRMKKSGQYVLSSVQTPEGLRCDSCGGTFDESPFPLCERCERLADIACSENFPGSAA